MRRLMEPHIFKTWLAFLLLAIIVIIVFQIVTQVEVIYGWFATLFWHISPFVGGFMLAYALNIPREGIEKLLLRTKHPFIEKRKMGISVIITYLAAAGVVWLAFILIWPRVRESVADFIAYVPTLAYQIQEFIYELSQNEEIPFHDQFDDIAALITPEAILSFFDGEFWAGIFTNLFSTVMGVISFIFRFALTIITSVYFMVESAKVKAVFKRIIKALAPHKVYKVILKYGNNINSYFKRYIYCQVLDAIILGTIMTLVLSVMNVTYAFTLGPMLGVANLIPFFGAIIGTVIAFIVILLTEDSTGLAVAAGVVMVVIQQFDANFIFPRLIGGQMKISPLVVIIGITIGNAYFGIVGMIVAIPIATVARNILDDFLLYREAIKSRKREVRTHEANER
ncbi:MAG: AI-2E family transporter [Defluviitaleaceae bacterium]|nr:AI-2E family transporter [Defluviitaleaceae bacterium]